MNLSKPLPHPRALAHLGDAVYELWVREAAIVLHEKTHDLHRYTISRVKAETQRKILEKLLPQLPEEQQALVKRAQNVPVTSSRRSDQASHRKATAFEALIGFWYLTDSDNLLARKEQVFQILEEILSENSQS